MSVGPEGVQVRPISATFEKLKIPILRSFQNRGTGVPLIVCDRYYLAAKVTHHPRSSPFLGVITSDQVPWPSKRTSTRYDIKSCVQPGMFDFSSRISRRIPMAYWLKSTNAMSPASPRTGRFGVKRTGRPKILKPPLALWKRLTALPPVPMRKAHRQQLRNNWFHSQPRRPWIARPDTSWRTSCTNFHTTGCQAFGRPRRIR
jgi:hypothetical protein